MSELDFISFARYWSDFQYVLLGMSMRYPELRLNGRKLVFFGDRSLDELAFRSYEIYLVNQYLSGHDLTIIDIGEARCQWSEDCDVVLAALLLQLGFNNYRAITRHSAWLYLAGGEDSLNLAEQATLSFTVHDLLEEPLTVRQGGRRADGILGLSKLLIGLEIS